MVSLSSNESGLSKPGPFTQRIVILPFRLIFYHHFSRNLYNILTQVYTSRFTMRSTFTIYNLHGTELYQFPRPKYTWIKMFALEEINLEQSE
jgi:hypothetical protein